MEFKRIEKKPGDWTVFPNLTNYPQAYSEFSWEQILGDLDGLPDGGGINIAHEAVDRHAKGPKKDKLALRWLGKDGEVLDFTYGDLREQTNRFANVLRMFGVGVTVWLCWRDASRRYTSPRWER